MIKRCLEEWAYRVNVVNPIQIRHIYIIYQKYD